MAEIEYRPWKKIVVHEVQEVPTKEFFEGLVAAVEAQKQGGNSPIVNWIDGIAFIFTPTAETETISNDRANGILHYNLVQFTRTSFAAEKKTPWQGRDYVVRMSKAEKNADFVNLVKFLAGRPPLVSS